MIASPGYYVAFYLSCYIGAISYLFLGMLACDKTFTFKRYIITALIVSTLSSLRNLIVGSNTAIGYVAQFAIYPLMTYFAFDQRGLRVLTSSILVLVIGLVLDLMFGLISMRFLTPEQIDMAKQIESPAAWAITVFGCAFMDIASIAIWWLTKTFRGVIRLDKPWIYVARPIVLAAATIGMFLVSITRISQLAPGERILELAATIGVMAVLLGLCIVYIYQDVQLLKIARSNESLVFQQHMYDTLLANTQAFRHNIANMLYGFEGAILTSDMKQIREYYDNMARKCARINNENIVALNRIANASVSALLLNKLTLASDEGIPMYLMAQEGLLWRGFRDEDLCQVLGALADNALEAAKDANSPYVAVEFCNVRNAMEIVVRNTYDEDKTNLGFLDGNIQSGKPDHEGIGLTAIRDILSRNKGVAFNQISRGRYVESLLLIE